MFQTIDILDIEITFYCITQFYIYLNCSALVKVVWADVYCDR